MSSPYARAVALVAATDGIQNVVRSARVVWQNRFAFTVRIDESDPIYTDVQAWLMGIIPETNQRAVKVTTTRHEHTSPGQDEPEDLRVTFNATRPHVLVVDGERVSVHVQRPEGGPGTTSSRRYHEEAERILFTSATRAGQRAVLRHIERIHETRKDDRKPVVMMVAPWGDWSPRRDLPIRPLTSVVIDHAQKARIVDDLRAFLNVEQKYNELAIPWHRGYLLHGPPGTGKTSLVKALASEFKLDLWYISLSDVKNEASLMTLLSRVEPKSILLLEDIDTIRISHDRDTQQGEISMSALLNALDGVVTPHGLITMMTTNHFDTLDPALTRAGRMDVVEEIGAPGWGEVEALFTHYYRQPLGIRATGDPSSVSMAAVAEVFKRHLDDPDTARAAITGLLTAWSRTGRLREEPEIVR